MLAIFCIPAIQLGLYKGGGEEYRSRERNGGLESHSRVARVDFAKIAGDPVVRQSLFISAACQHPRAFVDSRNAIIAAHAIRFLSLARARARMFAIRAFPMESDS